MNRNQLRIREEVAADKAAVYRINQEAFGRREEADLVDSVRATAKSFLSLVAVMDDTPVGHILFTPVDVSTGSDSNSAMGLGPVAVLPDHQRMGIGSRLIDAGLERCRQNGCAVVFVMGHQDYYPRFGFQPAADWDLHYKTHDFDAYFFLTELMPGAAAMLSGEVRYLPAFDEA